MAYDNTPLSYIVGRLGGDPEKKDTPKGDVVEFSVAEMAPDFDRDTKPVWYRASAWNDGHQTVLLGKNGPKKGSVVFVHGTVIDRGQYGFDIKVVQFGVVEMVARSKRDDAPPAAEEPADDF